MTDTKVDKISDEERLLAAMAYGEASASNDANELKALASVLVRQRDARGYATMKEFIDGEPSYSYVVGDGNAKYKKFNKPMKIILTVLFALGIIAAIASSNNSSTEKPTSSVSCEKEVDNITDSQSNEAETETESTVAGNREAATEADRQIYDIIMSADADYQTLTRIMSTDGVSIVDLYDTAKTAENNFRIYWGNIDSVKCDGIKEYKEAAKNYILNLQSIASSTKKYVDKQNIQDLSDAKAGMENSTNYAILVVGARLGFLTASGFSDEEAMQIIAPESEDTTG